MVCKRFIALVLLLIGNLSGAVTARGDMLADFTQKAVLKNPDVLSRWHAFRAATREIDVAGGAYLPRLDLSAGSGRESNKAPLADAASFTRGSLALTLTQTLYDGFATRDEVRRLNHAQLTRYYELLDVSESVALETTRAYLDVLKNRKLAELTQDNYVNHRKVFEQIKEKVKAGVGRRVDLEQASGRLALSEANLVSDSANVHDVSARFQRVVGELPPAEMAKPAAIGNPIPPNAADAHLSVAIEFHPAVLAAVENVRSSRYDLDGRRSRYQPKVDLRLSQTDGVNTGGDIGRHSNTVAEVVLNWNLYNGGSDFARTDQFAERLNAAMYQRDKVCRDIRQALAIAYNDVWKLTEQIRYLEQHQLAIEMARGAYIKQFEIGQRSLLDLLDTENELYQAKRAYVNAEFDLIAAHARTLAGMGNLAKSLGLSRLETANLPELLGTGSDAPESCPSEAPSGMEIRKDELDARAIAEAKPPEPSPPGEVPSGPVTPSSPAAPDDPLKPPPLVEAPGTPVPVKPSPALEASSVPAKASPPAETLSIPVTPETTAEAPSYPVGSPEALVERWISDWAGKHADAYLSHYDSAFLPEKRESREDWEAERRQVIGNALSIKVRAENLKMIYQGDDKATAQFAEMLEVGSYRRMSEKRLVLIRYGQEWKIREEKVLRHLASPSETVKDLVNPPTSAKKPTAPVVPEPVTAVPDSPAGPAEAFIERWISDWAGKNVDSYLSHYDAEFRPERGENRQSWEAERRRQIGNAPSIKVQAEGLKLAYQGDDRATARFTEMLKVGGYRRIAEKQLALIRRGQEWKIRAEKVLRLLDPGLF